ncbi:MAG: Asp-tRNA(Asn)/Glu-tRNA(Gln) amidotransferase subunit GatC [gamma proteobacterium symbiont of Taylorina sp.]|nr:Asp-tRNA(Asn)/Glu-tRNA(Gln) amidotransferase subunit GatC [gamma proteobacterium symbiont of Taylorina sp.]
MSKLDKSDVEKIAFLARLGINDQDIPEYATNLSNILDLVEQLDSINTDEVKPMSHPLDSVQRLRLDEVTEVNDRDNLMAHSPEVEAGLFLVPRVVE